VVFTGTGCSRKCDRGETHRGLSVAESVIGGAIGSRGNTPS